MGEGGFYRCEGSVQVALAGGVGAEELVLEGGTGFGEGGAGGPKDVGAGGGESFFMRERGRRLD